MNAFEVIRKSRGVPVKRNCAVTYRGTVYRVADITSTGGLSLVARRIVHPTDADLKYGVEDGIAAIRRHIRECETRIAERDNGERQADFGMQQTEERAFAAGLKRALEHMGVQP